MANRNCLEGFRCPACGSEEPFFIATTTISLVHDSGVYDYGDVNWDKNSYCRCGGCDHAGIVSDFDTMRKP